MSVFYSTPHPHCLHECARDEEYAGHAKIRNWHAADIALLMLCIRVTVQWQDKVRCWASNAFVIKVEESKADMKERHQTPINWLLLLSCSSLVECTCVVRAPQRHLLHPMRVYKAERLRLGHLILWTASSCRGTSAHRSKMWASGR